MALASARKTHESCDVLTLLLATQLYCASQALDLRFQDNLFRRALKEQILPASLKSFSPSDVNSRKIYNGMCLRLDSTNSKDLEARMEDVWRSVESLAVDASGGKVQAKDLANWRQNGAKESVRVYRSIQDAFNKG